MAINALDLIDQELAKAAAPKTSNKRPIFLFFKESHKALIRPLYNLTDALVLNKHSKWNDDPQHRVNAICAQEENHDCKYCAMVADDKKLSAQFNFYLPVYVYSVIDQSTGQKVTYKEKQEDGREVERPVSGVRVLELTSFGTIGAVLKFFREFMKEEEVPLTNCDFSISQVGAGQKKSFVCMPKTPKPMDPKVKELIPTAERLRERILDACQPQVADSAKAGIIDKIVEQVSEGIEVDENDIAVF
jgi:hypothetical protein